MNRPEEFIHMPIPASMFTAVCALLGGASVGTMAVAQAKAPQAAPVPAAAGVQTAEPVAAVQTGEVPAGATTGETDAAGTVFDPARHTGTKVKSGLWRMKTGLARGPGEGEDSPTYVNPNGATPAAASATIGAAASGSAAGAAAGTTATVVDDEDEFAAFSAAANAGAAPAAAKARTWSDADLSKLNNQAAQKLGSADPVRAAIAKFVPAGETPHSRNIPADQREVFAQEIEKVAGIEYAG